MNQQSNLAEALPFLSQRSIPPITILSILDEPEEQQAALHSWAECAQRWLQRSVVLDLKLLPVTPLAAVSPALLEAVSDHILILPWSASRSAQERHSGKEMLTQLLGFSPIALETIVCPQPPITWCFPLSLLGEWTPNAIDLSRLIAACPGWERHATLWSQGNQRIVVLRQPDMPDQREVSSVSRGMAQTAQHTDLYLRYLVRVLQAVIHVCWSDARTNFWNEDEERSE